MEKLLYITANPKETGESFSLRVGDAFLKAFKAAHPDDQVIKLDLYDMTLPLIDQDVFKGWEQLQKGKAFTDLKDDEQKKVGKLNEALEEFFAADKYVFVTPMWNLGLPPMMKAYIDAIMVPGQTFKYTEEGPVGLVENKKAIHIQASGGVYSEGPAKAMEFGNTYLTTVLNFIGITDVESILVEGMAQSQYEAEKVVEKAIAKVKETAKQFDKSTSSAS